MTAEERAAELLEYACRHHDNDKVGEYQCVDCLASAIRAAEDEARRDGEDRYIERHGSCPHKLARAKAEAALANMVERAERAEAERDGFRNGQEQQAHLFDLLWQDVHGPGGFRERATSAADEALERAAKAIDDACWDAQKENRLVLGAGTSALVRSLKTGGTR